MKIKDLLEFNPDAKIKVIMPNYIPFNGKLSYGWSCTEDDNNSSKNNATEVCIFLGDLNKNLNDKIQ